MLNKVIVASNPLDPETWVETETDNVCQFLFEYFEGVWPDTARLYYEQVSLANDITPIDKEGVEKLSTLNGTFYCVVYPAGAVAIIAIVAIVAVVAIAVLMKPAVPTDTLRNTQNSSPNNELSARTNEARLNARIPDIYGTVRSTPDLIGLSYTLFENNQEVEFSLMCVGRGYHEIHDVRDGETLLGYVSGSTAQFYDPFIDVSTGVPFHTVGTLIEDPFSKATKSNSVNGQILRAPNSNFYVGKQDIIFKYPDEIILQTTETNIDFTELFNVNDIIKVTNATFYGSVSSSSQNVQPLTTSSFRFPMPTGGLPSLGAIGDRLTMQSALFTVRDSLSGSVIAAYDLSGEYTISSISSQTVGSNTFAVIGLNSPSSINPQWEYVDDFDLPQATAIILKMTGVNAAFDLAGEYEILAVTSTLITLANPSAVNSDWDLLQDLPDQKTDVSSPTLSVATTRWIGPFILDGRDTTETVLNFYAQSGIYKDDGRNQVKYSVTVQIEITQIDGNGDDIGSPYLYTRTLEGSAFNKDSVGLTARIESPFVGMRRVRVRRSSETDLEFEGSVIDEVKWRDLYSFAPLRTTNFGNVTTIRTKTYATSGALTLKERKLNSLVTRKIPLWTGGKSFTSELFATNDAAEIFSAVCLDPRIGNRSVDEIDFDNLYGIRDEAVSYFGSNKCFEFCYTFDSDNISFEETVESVSEAVFCQAYRRGNIIKWLFRKKDDDSVMLFNHRNKVPTTEIRTQDFGFANDKDGIEFSWVDPEDDAVVTMILPDDNSALNPEKIESVGVRNGLHAHIHAWRAWNRIRYQNLKVEFEGLQETNSLVRHERILVANNTRPKTIDGDIVEQDGLLLVASQYLDVEDNVPYTVFLQLTDKTVEAIPVQSVTGREILLSRPPRLPLVVDAEMFVRTVFTLVSANSTRSDAFLVETKEPVDNFTTKLTAVNYSDKYWQNDKDFINGIVDENGN